MISGVARAIVAGVATAALAGSVAGCSGDGGDNRASGDDTSPTQTEAPGVELEGHSFTADEVSGRDIAAGTAVRIAFEDDTMSASAGCNTHFGAYVEDNGLLRWSGEPASTSMSCEESLSKQDSWLTALLLDGVTIEEGEADLTLAAEDVTIELSRTDPEDAGEAPIERSQLDFAARVNGPITARPDQVAKFTLTNIGRRRDTYGITITPADGGVVAPRHLALGSGRSAKFRVRFSATPLIIKVESLGAGGFVDAFTVQ